MERNCSICGKKLRIKLNSDKTYEGGHYFSNKGKDLIEGAEYWECDKCFNKNKCIKQKATKQVNRGIGDVIKKMSTE